MGKYIKYIKKVLTHKWFVFVEACKLGIPWLGLIHDASKFLPDEFFAYARYDFTKFGNNDKEKQRAFDLAWLKHQKRNRHHWQYWLLMNDSGLATRGEPGPMKQVEPLPMPERYVREMVADWRGAGRAYGNSDTVGWYQENKDRIVLHQKTEKLTLTLLGIR